MIYLIGSLRNPEVPRIAEKLRAEGHIVFDAWYSAGALADDSWRDHEKFMGHSFIEALRGPAATHVFGFDKKFLTQADTVVLVLPAGKSGHLELGWALGQGKKGYILLDSLDRWDVMYSFATGVFDSFKDLVARLRQDQMHQEKERDESSLDAFLARTKVF